MIPTETGERRAGLKAHLLERLHDPPQLRILVIGLVLAAGYGGVYMPLNTQISESTAKLNREKKLAELAAKLEQLQARQRSFEKWLPHQADTKEWMQYVYDGIRGFPLTMSKLNCLGPRQIGPYQVIVLQIELQGSLFDLDRFLRWLDSNPRLFRVDDINIALANAKKQGTNKAKQNLDDMVMGITVLGMAG
jgi:Tfp pilus assembly protein PilO